MGNIDYENIDYKNIKLLKGEDSICIDNYNAISNDIENMRKNISSNTSNINTINADIENMRKNISSNTSNIIMLEEKEKMDSKNLELLREVADNLNTNYAKLYTVVENYNNIYNNRYKILMEKIDKENKFNMCLAIAALVVAIVVGIGGAINTKNILTYHDTENKSEYVEESNDIIFEVIDKKVDNNKYYLILEDNTIEVSKNIYENTNIGDRMILDVTRVYDKDNNLIDTKLKYKN